MEFYELKIWKKGHELILIIYKVTSNYPEDEKFNLTTQTRRSAVSIISLISEAHGRYHYADRIRVLYQARGEVVETRSHIRIGHDLKYLPDKEFQYLEKEYSGLEKGINAYIQSISKNKGTK